MVRRRRNHERCVDTAPHGWQRFGSSAVLWSPELRAQLKLEFWLLASSQPSCRCCATHVACGTAPRRFRPHRRQHQRQRSRTPAAKLEFFKAQLARARLPPVEQKVFDATNSDAWGPHGTVLGEIARCTASPDERAQVLSVLWRRVAEDKPDQWRCVYKALAVLEYLVANGSEAVVDELCNLAPRRLASLSGFQYKDTDGKDQGINVRHKSATLLELLSDRQKIQQVRAKALANRNKYSGVSADEMRSAQGIVRPVEQRTEDDEFRIRDTSGPRQSDTDSGFTPKFQVKMSSAPRAAPTGPAPKLQMGIPPPPSRLVPPAPPPKPAAARPVAAADAFGLAALSAPPAPSAAPPPAATYAVHVSQPPAATPPNLLDDLLGTPVPAMHAAAGFGQPPVAAPSFASYSVFPAPGGTPAAAAPAADPFAADPFGLLATAAMPAAAGAGAFGMPPPPMAAPVAPAARVDPFMSFPPPPVVQQSATMRAPGAPLGAGALMGRSSGGMPLGTPSQARKPATLDEALNASLNLLS